MINIFKYNQTIICKHILMILLWLYINIHLQLIQAVKVFRKSQLLKKKEYFRKKEGGMGFKSQLSKVQQEIAIMKKLVHPNLIQLYEVIDYDEGDKLYMIMDYAQNGEILKWNQKTCRFRPFQNGLDQLLESDIKKYMRHCIRGLHFMHSNNIVHRDIKPQNILITDNFKAKLGDFGVSQLYEREEDDKISKTEGTYHFMAPECCDPDVESFSGKAADIWALGVTLYCMVFNELPFWDETEFGIIQKIHKEEIKISESRQISKGLRHLLSRMLEKNPEKRAQIQELRENSWINEGCKTALIQEETSFISELTEADLQHALTPIHRIVFAKKFGKQWKINASNKAMLIKQKSIEQDDASPFDVQHQNPSLNSVQLSTASQNSQIQNDFGNLDLNQQQQ